MLFWDDVRTNGAEPSSDSLLPSFPLVCSKKIPYPPRIAILPSPLGSHANPRRGAGLNKCPLRQPAFEEGPTLAEGNAARIGPGIAEVPPLPPHWMIPSNGFPVPVSAPEVGSIAGELAATKAPGSKLNACL